MPIRLLDYSLDLDNFVTDYDRFSLLLQGISSVSSVRCRRAEQSFFFLLRVPVLAPVRGRGQLEEAAVMTAAR